MRFLRTNTAVIITVGPFYDKTDGVTIETALTITNEKITLTADTDAGSAPTNILDNVTGATSGTANDLNYITGNDAGMMQLELAAADVNRLGRMFLSITDAANHVPVFHEFMVLPTMIYDSFILGTDVLDASVTQILGTAASTPATAGILEVNVKNWNNLATVDLPLVPTTAGRKLDVSAGGEAGVDWANVGSPTTSLALTGTTIAVTQKVDVDTIKTNPVVNAGTITFPTAATLASTTNITAGTIATATAVTTVNGLAAGVITAAAIADAAIDRATFAADTGLQSARSGTAQAGAAGSITLDASASAADDYYKGEWIYLTGGTGIGQARLCTGYTGSTKIAAVAPNWVTNPDNTTTSAILPAAKITGVTLADTLATYTGNTPQTGDSFARIGATGSGLTALASQASLDTLDDYVDTEVAAIKTQTDKMVFTVTNQLDVNVLDWKSATAPAMTGDAYARLGIPAGASVSADLAAVKVDTAADLLLTGTNGVVVAAASKTGYRLSATGVGDLLTTALTESYAADGAAPTLSQALFAIQQMLQERSISSTTLTVKKLDGSTSAMTFTLDSASSPTSITRAS